MFGTIRLIDGSLGAGGNQGNELAELGTELVDLIVIDLDEPIGFEFLWETDARRIVSKSDAP